MTKAVLEVELLYLNNLGGRSGTMRKRKIFVNIIILVFCLLITAVLSVYIVAKKSEDSKYLTVYLPRSQMPSSNWSYEFSNNSILMEVDEESYDYFMHRYDYWEFSPIAGVSGEVTIYFIAQYHTEIVEEDCFSITYYVDDSGKATEISSDNKPATVNFDNNIIGLIWLKAVDLVTYYLFEILSFVIDSRYMRLFRAN